MRILMLNNEFPPLGGGQGVVNQRLLEEFSKITDLEIDLITASRSANDWSSNKLTSNATIHYVPVDNKNIHHSSAVELIRYFFRALTRARKLVKLHKYNLTFAFSAVPAGPISWWLKLVNGIPYLTRSPGVDIPGFENRYKFLYPILKPIISLVWNSAATNIVSSEMHRDLMLAVKPDARSEVIYNGVDRTLFAPGDNDSSTVRILCVARLVKRKGIDILLNAFADLILEGAQAELLLVGTGDDDQILKHDAAALGISNQVKFIGFVERADMPQIYKNADVFVLPSHNEGMSNAALEALSAGLPLVMTKVGGATELIEEGHNGFIVPVGDRAALTARLYDLLSNPSLRKAMGEASFNRAENFGWTAISKQYLEVIRRYAIKDV